jgi:hypothetical protein
MTSDERFLLQIIANNHGNYSAGDPAMKQDIARLLEAGLIRQVWSGAMMAQSDIPVLTYAVTEAGLRELGKEVKP